jgi:N-acylneuraminate cytidylyltransferase
MKHRSERVPGKNMRPLGGKPLFHWILGSLSQSKYVSQVVINTDSKVIADDARKYFDVKIIMRPDHLIGDMIVANELIEFDLTQLEEVEFFLQTHSTNPFLTTSSIDCAIEKFFRSYPENDSLFSVTKTLSRFWTEDCKPMNHELGSLIRTQDLKPIFEENSCIYIFHRDSFLKRKNRIGECPLLYELDPLEAIDIDEEIDFHLAECLSKLKADAKI